MAKPISRLGRVVEVYKNHYTLECDLEISYSKTKSVTVDGEVYEKKTYHNYNTNSLTVLINENRSNISKINIPLFDLEYYWIDNTSLSNHFIDKYRIWNYRINSPLHANITSENDYVMMCVALFENNVFDKRIIDITTSDRYISNMVHGKFIWLPIFNYGFNNSFCVKIHLIDFFSIENKRDKIGSYYYSEIKDYFIRKYNIDIEESLNFKDVMKILTKKIQRHETN